MLQQEVDSEDLDNQVNRVKRIKAHRKTMARQLKNQRRQTFSKGNDAEGFQCIKCKEKLADRNKVSNHFRKHYDEIDATIKRMEENFIREARRSRNKRSQSNRSSSEQKIQPQFKKAKTLNLTGKKRQRPTASKEKKIPCKLSPQCKQFFSDYNKMRRHMLSHTGEKKWTCDICKKQFSLEYNMKIHQRIHTGERPFQCSYPDCGRKFAQKTNLKSHEEKHSVNSFLSVKTETSIMQSVLSESPLKLTLPLASRRIFKIIYAVNNMRGNSWFEELQSQQRKQEAIQTPSTLDHFTP